MAPRKGETDDDKSKRHSSMGEQHRRKGQLCRILAVMKRAPGTMDDIERLLLNNGQLEQDSSGIRVSETLPIMISPRSLSPSPNLDDMYKDVETSMMAQPVESKETPNANVSPVKVEENGDDVNEIKWVGTTYGNVHPRIKKKALNKAEPSTFTLLSLQKVGRKGGQFPSPLTKCTFDGGLDDGIRKDEEGIGENAVTP